MTREDSGEVVEVRWVPQQLLRRPSWHDDEGGDEGVVVVVDVED